MVSHLAAFLASLIPVLVAVKVARDRRGSCSWPLDKVKSQMWVSILIIVASQVVIFTPARPFSPLALLSFVVEVFGVYRLSKAIYRKKDLAKSVSLGSKTMKLNGWKRIGIVASVVWILGAGIYTYDSEIDRASGFITSTHVACDSNLGDKTGDAWTESFNECNKQADDSLALALTNARLEAALVAFAPVPLGWGFVYLILFLVRWIKRGFMRPETPVKGS